MTDVAKASVAHRRFALTVVLAALAALVCAVVAGEADRERVLSRFHIGYQQRVSALLAEGKAVAALDELESGSFIDESRIEMLNRIARLNQAASFVSPPTAQLFAHASGDAALRLKIGQALLTQLDGAGNLTEAERKLLERATKNARMLVALNPRSARSHYLMGRVYLLRGSDTGSSSELSSAISSLKRAILLDPNDLSARRALEEARSRSGS